jgi:hypothetical protein
VRREASFGVVIAATRDHLHWVRGTCASVRYFMGEVPIAVLLDGRVPPNDLEKTVDAEFLLQHELDNPVLRELSGSTKAKLAVLWEAPFERFLFLDADTVVWGNLGELADFDRSDFVVDAPYGRRRSRLGVMDAAAATRSLADFDASAYEDRFVNTGVFFGTRGLLRLDRFLELLEFSLRRPEVLLNDQGFFNHLLFNEHDAGHVRVEHRPLQVKVGEDAWQRSELAEHFAFVDGQPHVTGAPTAIHWVGTLKPTMRTGANDFFAPMTFFRREYRRLRNGRPQPNTVDDLALRLEDFRCADWRGRNMRGRLRRIRRRSTRHARHLLGRAKVSVRARTPDRVVTGLRRRP